MASRAERFLARFAGLDRAHGEYVIAPGAKPNGKGKVEGKALTVHAPVTLALWERHLAGDGALGLGVVPIKDDATAGFGAIDVDIYPLEIPRLAKTVADYGLPLVPCRTKSGGCHLYLFGAEPLPAALVRAKLMEWAVLLGHGGVEVFPKQVKLAGERDYGNWINLPYQAGERTVRYAVAPTGEALGPDEFLDLADRLAVTLADLQALVPLAPPGVADRLEDGPPCLQSLARASFPEGTRNNALFNLAVYAKKAHPDDWATKVEAYNALFLVPPLTATEVKGVVGAVGKKSYGYRCKQPPIVGACNRQLCLTRKHGVGGLPDDPGIALGAVAKVLTDPVTWIVDVNGTRLELVTADLMDQRAFHARVFEQLSIWPVPIKPGTWRDMISDRIREAEEIEVPEDATPQGQWWVLLERFLAGRAQARTLDELLLGKPHTDPDKGRTYFCAADALAYLHQQRVTGLTEKKFYGLLRKHGVEHHFSVVKGKGLNYWSVPAVNGQTQPFDPPKTESAGEF